MIRITIEQDFGAPVMLKWGYEIMVPMSFGPASPEMMTEFRGPREPLPAQPLQWELDYRDPEKRSVILQDDAVAIQYFGDPRSAASDHPLVRDKRVPNFNDERIRVAMVWGDYIYSDRYGPYTSVRVRVPQIPHVVIQRTNASGSAISDSAFRPHAFFRWEEMLVSDADAQYADMVARGKPRTLQGGGIDLANLSDDELDKLANALRNRAQKAKAS